MSKQSQPIKDTIDYEELINMCNVFREIHNDTEERQLPPFGYFKQEDLDYVTTRGWSHYIMVVLHINPTLATEETDRYSTPLQRNPIKHHKTKKFVNYYEKLTEVQELYLDLASNTDITWHQAQQAYIDFHINHKSLDTVAEGLGIDAASKAPHRSLNKYLYKEYIRRHAVPGSYDK